MKGSCCVITAVLVGLVNEGFCTWVPTPPSHYPRSDHGLEFTGEDDRIAFKLEKLAPNPSHPRHGGQFSEDEFLKHSDFESSWTVNKPSYPQKSSFLGDDFPNGPNPNLPWQINKPSYPPYEPFHPSYPIGEPTGFGDGDDLNLPWPLPKPHPRGYPGPVIPSIGDGGDLNLPWPLQNPYPRGYPGGYPGPVVPGIGDGDDLNLPWPLQNPYPRGYPGGYPGPVIPGIGDGDDLNLPWPLQNPYPRGYPGGYPGPVIPGIGDGDDLNLPWPLPKPHPRGYPGGYPGPVIPGIGDDDPFLPWPLQKPHPRGYPGGYPGPVIPGGGYNIYGLPGPEIPDGSDFYDGPYYGEPYGKNSHLDIDIYINPPRFHNPPRFPESLAEYPLPETAFTVVQTPKNKSEPQKELPDSHFSLDIPQDDSNPSSAIPMILSVIPEKPAQQLNPSPPESLLPLKSEETNLQQLPETPESSRQPDNLHLEDSDELHSNYSTEGEEAIHVG